MIKKKLAIALIAVAIVGVFSTGAIFAYFSDTRTASGNSFTAGTLELQVTDPGTWSSTPYNLGNVYPGATGSRDIELVNVGTIAGTLTASITNVKEGPGATANDPEKNDEPTGTDVANLGKYLTVTVMADANGDGTYETTIYNGLVNPVSTGPFSSVSILSGGTLPVRVTYAVADIDNRIQGDTCEFDVSFTLKQS